MQTIKDAIFQGLEAADQIGMVLLDGERLAWASRSVFEIFQYDDSEIIGRFRFEGLLPAEDRPLAREHLERLRSGRQDQFELEARGRRKDGRTIHCLFKGRLVDYQGRRAVLVCIADISERVASLLQLRQREQLYRSIVEASADGIAVIDPKGVVIEWNRAQEELTGYTRLETLGHFIWDVQHRSAPAEARTPQALEQARRAYQASLGDRPPDWISRTFEHPIERPDGSQRWLQTRTFAIPTEQGLMIGSISRDLTAGHAED